MKTCPLCRESIQVDAIKCKHCYSMLIPISPASPEEEKKNGDNDKQVTYVVDKGIIQFAKFAIPLLGIFIIVGAYFFGWDLSKASDKLYQLRADLTNNTTEFNKTKAVLEQEINVANTFKGKIDDATDKLDKAGKRITELEQQMEALLDKAQKKYDGVALLQPKQLMHLDEQKKIHIEKFGAGKFWKSGVPLRVRFLNGDDKLQSFVRETASEWTKYANLKFQFTNEIKDDAEIRITFGDNGEDAGVWSFRGTDALGIPKTEPTMCLEAIRHENDRDKKTTVLHYFGYALGLQREIMNPKMNLTWNEAEAVKYFTGSWNMSKAMADEIISRKGSKYDYERDFDPKSIMMDPIPKGLLMPKDIEIPKPTELSESDKQLIAKLYPK